MNDPLAKLANGHSLITLKKDDMIKKSIYFFAVLFLTPNAIKSQEVNILIKDYALLEYVSTSHNYTQHIIRAKNQNLWFDFWIKIDDYDSNYNYKLNESIEIDSFFVDSPFLLYSHRYICIYKDNQIMRFRCNGVVIYKISESKVYIFNGRNWSLDADFKLLPTPNKNCYEKERETWKKTGAMVMPEREELILDKISYSKSGQKIFSFVKCLPTSIIQYKYIKDLGRIEFRVQDIDVIWRLHKIENEIVEIW